MKKEVKIAFVLMLLLLLVGCGAKEDEDVKEKESEKVTEKEKKPEKEKDGVRVDCSQSQKEDGMNLEMVMSAYFKKSDNSFVNFDINVNMDYSEAVKDISAEEKKKISDQVDQIGDTFEDSFEEEYGLKMCNVNNKNSKLSIACSGDLDDITKMSDGEINSEMTPDSFIEAMKQDDESLVCKTTEVYLDK